jgi:cytochrome c nitrite reductase small subunit
MLGKETLLAAFLGVAIGFATGVGAYTFYYARGASYPTNDPAACANCHVMQEHFDGWVKSSHRSVAACNDCHTPPGAVSKVLTKASNGFWHSFAFTTGAFREPIRIKPHNRWITENACAGCHQEVIAAIQSHYKQGRISCVGCHSSVGHPS